MSPLKSLDLSSQQDFLGFQMDPSAGPPEHEFLNLDLAARNQDWQNRRGNGGGGGVDAMNDHYTKLFSKVFQYFERT